MVNPIKSIKSKLARGKSVGNKENTDIEIPQDFDILLGRGKTSFNHVGNRRFRVFINLHLRRYMDAGSRMEKTMVVNSVVEAIHEAGGRFLKQDTKTGKWSQVNAKMAREKVGHALRDAVGMRMKMTSKGGTGNTPPPALEVPTLNLHQGRERRASDIATARARRMSAAKRPSLLLPEDQVARFSKSCGDLVDTASAMGSIAEDARKALLELDSEGVTTDDLDPIPVTIPEGDEGNPSRVVPQPVQQYYPNPRHAKKIFEDAAHSFGKRTSEMSNEFSVMSEGTSKWFGASDLSVATIDSKVFDDEADMAQLKEEVAKTLQQEFPSMGPPAASPRYKVGRSKKSRKPSDVDLSEEFSTMSLELRNGRGEERASDLMSLRGEDPFSLKSEEFGLKPGDPPVPSVITGIENLRDDLVRGGSSTEFSLKSNLRSSDLYMRSSSRSSDSAFRGSSTEFMLRLAKASTLRNSNASIGTFDARDSNKMRISWNLGGDEMNPERVSFLSGINPSESIIQHITEESPGMESSEFAGEGEDDDNDEKGKNKDDSPKAAAV